MDTKKLSGVVNIKIKAYTIFKKKSCREEESPLKMATAGGEDLGTQAHRCHYYIPRNIRNLWNLPSPASTLN